jgi:hypothetical protein
MIELTCDETTDWSILSTVRNGCDSIEVPYEHPILRFFTTKEARELRLVCSEFLDAVEITPWNDTETRIVNSSDYTFTCVTDELERWRECFPAAIGAKVRDNSYLRNDDFIFFAGLQFLNISYCWGYDDAAFKHLQMVRVLDITQDFYEPVYNAEITNHALSYLHHIEELTTSDCKGITSYEYIPGIRKLTATQISDNELIPLQGIKELHLRTCRGITEDGFQLLHKIRKFTVKECPQFGACDVCLLAKRTLSTILDI